METGIKIKCLRSDRGGEFTSNPFNKYCETQGIKRQLTTAYTPQQNGVAEQRNRTLENMVRCLLTEKYMPKFFWPEATRWACHVINRCVSRSLDEKVPEELWTGSKPSVEHFKIFGCIGHVHVPAQLRKKLDARSHKCVFLGVSQESKAYRLYDPTNKKIVISRDAIFDEDASWNWSKENQVQQELIIEDDEVQESQQEDEGLQTPSQSLPTPNSGGTNPQIQSMSQPKETSIVSNSPVSHDSENSRVHNTPIPQIRSPVRNRRPPAWTNDYYMSCNTSFIYLINK